ncbi:hypothetical protein [Amycolatopsis thermophila]|uniref:Uncharacterized protein n=1 Tax=Amycolatopsis thermophila TaxID=206084 RepID=A0ABU0F3A5_9PSEU|nr:hypothetical protein [Amycolatopsis thermophila]MDQ0382032.1 hypothetical protein [Amycolatopsis thermophila]
MPSTDRATGRAVRMPAVPAVATVRLPGWTPAPSPFEPRSVGVSLAAVRGQQRGGPDASPVAATGRIAPHTNGGHPPARPPAMSNIGLGYRQRPLHQHQPADRCSG